MGCVCVGGMEMPEVTMVSPANGDVHNKTAANDVNGNSVPVTVPLTGPQHGEGTDWIDAALVAEAVGEEPENIRDVTIKAAVAAGDNYCSTMWRVSATAGDRPVHLIVKAPPKGEMMQSFIEKMGFFDREIRMLKETLPAMRVLALDRCGSDHVLAKPLGPVAMPCSLPGVLVMNDLSVGGYRNKERQGQLDMQHCKMALEILARLHALSVALHRQDPASMEGYGETLFARHAEDRQHRVMTENQIKKFGTLVETWEQTKERQLGDKIRKLAPRMFDIACDVVLPHEDKSKNVLNHGDFWINNMMFRYDGQETTNPRDIQIVDLQICRFSSQALDLQYFIVSSAQEQVREERLDELLRHYCDHYNTYVSDLGVEDAQTPFEELKAEFIAKSLFGFTVVYTVLCAVVAQPEDKLQLDNLTADNIGDADISSKAWRGKTFQRIAPKLLLHYDDMGVLDVE